MLMYSRRYLVRVLERQLDDEALRLKRVLGPDALIKKKAKDERSAVALKVRNEALRNSMPLYGETERVNCY